MTLSNIQLSLYSTLLGQQQQALILPEPLHGTPPEQNSYGTIGASAQEGLMLLEQQHVNSMSDNQRLKTALVRTQDQMGRIQSANQESVLILKEENSILSERLSTANSRIAVLEERDRSHEEEIRALKEQFNNFIEVFNHHSKRMSTEENTRTTQFNNLMIGQSQLSDRMAAEEKRSVTQDIVVLEKFEAIETRQLNLEESMNQELIHFRRQFTGMNDRVDNAMIQITETNDRLTVYKNHADLLAADGKSYTDRLVANSIDLTNAAEQNMKNHADYWYKNSMDHTNHMVSYYCKK